MEKTRNDAICDLRRAGWKHADIASVFDVSASRVVQICGDFGLCRSYRPRRVETKQAQREEAYAAAICKSPKSRRAAEIRAKYLQWAREAEVA
jgi:hypothetical protein